MDICVRASRNCSCQERLPWHAEEPTGAKQIVWRILTTRFGIYCIYICCFLDLMQGTRSSLYVFIAKFVCFFFCLAAMIFSVNTANIQYFWVFLDIQINYNWKSIISLLKYCTLQKTHFALQCWQPYFFMTTPTRNTVYFSSFLAVKYVSLIL